jgi:hypothetical protein
MQPSQLALWGCHNGIPPTWSSTFTFFAIIEPQVCPQWQQWLYEAFSEPTHAALFKGTPYAEINDGPVLIALNATLLGQIISACESVPAGCILAFDENTAFDDVLLSIQGRLSASAGEAMALLRYFEPRMLLPLWGGLSQEEKARLFSGVRSLHWFNHTWLSAAPSNQDTPISSLTYPLAITATHKSTMQDIAEQWAAIAQELYA